MKKQAESVVKTNTYSEIEYENMRDKAMSMAFTLKKIEQEAIDCARCGGKSECGYSSMDFLKEVCYLLAQNIPYQNEFYPNYIKTEK